MSELFNLQETTQVETNPFPFQRPKLQGLDTIPDLSVLVTGNTQTASPKDAYRLYSAGRLHGRSHIAVFGEKDSILKDDYGNRYGDLTLKGGDGRNPYIRLDYKDGEYLFEGVGGYLAATEQEMQRQVVVSEFLAQIGISADRILDIKKMKTVGRNGRYMPVNQFKKELLKERINRNPLSPIPSDAVSKIKKELEEVDLFLVLRAQQVANTFSDLCRGDKSDFLQMLHAAIDFLNIQKREKKETDFIKTEGNYPFLYITNTFPTYLGETYGRLHAAGVVHDNSGAHGANWQTTAGLRDLDSMRGEPFGDPRIEVSDIAADLERIIANPYSPDVYSSGYTLRELVEKKFIIERGDTFTRVTKAVKGFNTAFVAGYIPTIEARYPEVVSHLRRILPYAFQSDSKRST